MKKSKTMNEKQIDTSTEAASGNDFLMVEIDGRKWAYSLNDDGTAYLVGRPAPKPAGELVIPSEVNGSKVKEIGILALSGYGDITSVKIPDGVKEIYSGAFWGCSALTEVTIPASVERIGLLAFNGCNNLSTIKVASGDAERVKQMVKFASVLIKREKVEKTLLDEIAKNATEKGTKIAEDDTSTTSLRALSAEETEDTLKMFEKLYNRQEATYKNLNAYLDAIVGDADTKAESSTASDEKEQDDANDCGEGFTWVYQSSTSSDISRLAFVEG